MKGFAAVSAGKGVSRSVRELERGFTLIRSHGTAPSASPSVDERSNQNARVVGSLLAVVTLSSCTSQPCEPPECDIRRAACQREIMIATACLREAEPRRVPAEVIALDDFLRENKEEVSDEIQERFEQYAEGLALLGLQAAASYDEVFDALYGQVGAFYNPSDDRITVLHRNESLDDMGMVLTMVHEFSHALQYDWLDEQASDGAQRISTLDASLARSAIFEGDATSTTDRAAVLMFKQDPERPNWERIYGGWARSERKRYLQEPYRVSLAGRYFPYAYGSEFLEPVRRERGQAAINQWLLEPAGSTRAIVRGPYAADEEPSPGDFGPVLTRDAGGAMAPTADAAIPTDAAIRTDAAAAPGAAADAAIAADAATTADAATAADAGRAVSSQSLLIPELPQLRLTSVDALGAFVFSSYAASVADQLRDVEAERIILRDSWEQLIFDHLSLWEHAELGGLLAVYRLRFSEEGLAESWARALDRVRPGTGSVVTHVSRHDVIIAATIGEQLAVELDVANWTWRLVDPAELPQEVTAAPYFEVIARGGMTLRRASWFATPR